VASAAPGSGCSRAAPPSTAAATIRHDLPVFTSESSIGPVDAVVVPLKRCRAGKRLLFVVAVLCAVLALAVLAVPVFLELLSHVYLTAPGFLIVLSVPFTIAWWTRPSRPAPAELVLDRAVSRAPSPSPTGSARGPRARRSWPPPSWT
jgi:hypothetical protein